MARYVCKCGEILSNSFSPNDIELRVYTDREWDEIINVQIFDPICIPLPQFDVWRCPKCERIYFFRENEVVKVYVVEK